MVDEEKKKEKEKKTKRRSSGEGTVFKKKFVRKDGTEYTRFVAEIRVDGKVKTFYGDQEGEAIKKRKEFLAEYKNKKKVTPNDILLKDWIKQWLELYKKVSLRPTTYETYTVLLDKHISLPIGHIPLQKLNTDDLQSLAGGMKDKLSPRTIKDVFSILKSCMAKAIEKEIIIKNPVTGMEIPTVIKKEKVILSLEQIQEFKDKNKKHPLYPAFMIQLMTGIRRGEVLALRNKDVDLTNRMIHIRKNLVYVIRQGLIIQEPKTTKSKRVIPLPDELTVILQLHKPNKNKYGLLFCTSHGQPIHPRSYQRSFDKIFAKDLGDDITIHSLRRTFATHMAALGVDMKTTADIMGHTDTRMTADIYTHPQIDMLRSAMDKLNAAIKKS